MHPLWRVASWEDALGAIDEPRKAKVQERYKVDYSRDHDAFPEPNWLTQPLAELIGASVLARPRHRRLKITLGCCA